MRGLSTPIAIVVAGALIGVGTWLGLRGRPIVYVTASEPAVRSPAPPRPAPASADVQARAAVAVRQALESQRKELAARCWLPATGPARETFQVRMLFNPVGRLFSYAVNDPPDGQRLDVAKCLRNTEPTVSIPPTGGVITVELALDLP